MKSIFITFAAVLGGIWLWNRYKFAKAGASTSTTIAASSASPCAQGSLGCYGPPDPKTGDYNPTGTGGGTVAFSSYQTGGAVRSLARTKI